MCLVVFNSIQIHLTNLSLHTALFNHSLIQNKPEKHPYFVLPLQQDDTTVSNSANNSIDLGTTSYTSNHQGVRINVLNRVGHQQDKWKRQVREQRRNIYDRHTMLNQIHLKHLLPSRVRFVQKSNYKLKSFFVDSKFKSESI